MFEKVFKNFSGLDGKCLACKTKEDVSMCSKCGKLFCLEDMKKHLDKSEHLLTMKLTDFSFWCNGCNRKIDNSEFVQF
jgi:hypothetical protein